MHVGEKFRVLRKALGQTQDKFSQTIGIPLSTLKGIETANHMPSYNILNKLTTNPQLSRYVMWLLSDSDSDEPLANQNVQPIDSRLKDIIIMVEDVLAETDISINANKKADLIFYLYEKYIESDDEQTYDMTNVIKLVRMAA